MFDSSFLILFLLTMLFWKLPNCIMINVKVNRKLAKGDYEISKKQKEYQKDVNEIDGM